MDYGRIPYDLAAAPDSEPEARAVHRALPAGHRREYPELMEEAERPETRRRIGRTIGMLHG